MHLSKSKHGYVSIIMRARVFVSRFLYQKSPRKAIPQGFLISWLDFLMGEEIRSHHLSPLNVACGASYLLHCSAAKPWKGSVFTSAGGATSSAERCTSFSYLQQRGARERIRAYVDRVKIEVQIPCGLIFLFKHSSPPHLLARACG